jgi:hypothetical protein
MGFIRQREPEWEKRSGAIVVSGVSARRVCLRLKPKCKEQTPPIPRTVHAIVHCLFAYRYSSVNGFGVDPFDMKLYSEG